MEILLFSVRLGLSSFSATLRRSEFQGDIVCLSCIASHNRDGVLGSERVCLCTEGFGNRMCTLENVSDRVSSL